MKKIGFRNWKKIAVIFLVTGILLFALSGYMAKVFDALVTPLIGAETWFSSRVNTLSNLFISSGEAARLKAENERLQDELGEKKAEIVELEQSVKEAEILYALLGFARRRPEENYISAMVIGSDPSPFLKYILIDKGTDDGIRYGMPVVTDKGLVGRIEAVTATAARVKLISDSTSVVNGTIVELDAECVVKGSVTGDVTIEMVTQDKTLEANQTIQTSGLGGDYPSGVPIGYVLSPKSESGTFNSASISPAENFSTLKAVLVVASFHTSDIDPLEY